MAADDELLMSRDELLQRAIAVMREVLLHPEWPVEEMSRFVQQSLPAGVLNGLGLLFAVVQMSLNELRSQGFTAEDVEVWHARALTEAMDMEMNDPGVGRGEE
jgi:hypothetical protein